MAPFLGIILTLCGLTEIKTDSESSSPNGLYTISDDPDQGVFTVSIKSTEEGTQSYWCAVKIPGAWDEKKKIQLLVSDGKSSLYVDQQGITGFEGDGMKISFYSQTQGKPGWCKLGHCKDQQEGYIEGSQVSIDTNKSDVFVVTMRDLDMESSGWYIFSQGKRNMPIRLTVAVRPKTTNTSKFKSVASKEIYKMICLCGQVCHTETHTHTQTETHTRTHTHAHTRMCTHTHTHTRTHKCTHTHTAKISTGNGQETPRMSIFLKPNRIVYISFNLDGFSMYLKTIFAISMIGLHLASNQ